MTLTGSDTLADYQTVLQTITYQNSSTNLDGAVRQIQVVACDGTSSSPVATANITLLAKAVPPVAVDITATTDKDSDLDIPLLADNADPSPGDTIQVTQVDAAKRLGVPLTLEDDGSVDYACTQSAALATLTAGQSVTDTFDYTITDSRGLTSTGQVTVTVTGENDPPQAAGIPDVAHAVGGAATTIELTQYFSDEQDAAADLTYTVADVSNPALFSSVSIDPTSQLLTLNYAPGAFGTSYVTICGTDSLGLTARRPSPSARPQTWPRSAAYRSRPRLAKGRRSRCPASCRATARSR